ncbi:MAG TPA: hypothetical protein VFO44_09330 [Steroidobacteraceae bacterium]|nr:hypothetical protein [Steroidobacteraceae bacterium]
MLRTILICTLVSASLLGCATSPNPRTASAKDAALRPNCIRDTGSRLPANPPGCQNVAGRSYSQDDIDRTGQTDAANALRMLDPSVTVHH